MPQNTSKIVVVHCGPAERLHRLGARMLEDGELEKLIDARKEERNADAFILPAWNMARVLAGCSLACLFPPVLSTHFVL